MVQHKSGGDRPEEKVDHHGQMMLKSVHSVSEHPAAMSPGHISLGERLA